MYVCMYVCISVHLPNSVRQSHRELELHTKGAERTLGATEHRRLLTMLLTDREGHTRVSRDIFAFLYAKLIVGRLSHLCVRAVLAAHTPARPTWRLAYCVYCVSIPSNYRFL